MNTRLPLAFILSLSAILVVPAMLSAQRTSFDFDATIDFSKYRTFALAEGTPAPDAFLHARIVRAIESQLLAHGLTRDDTRPDIYVLYHVVLDTRRTVTGWSGDGFGPFGWGWGGGRVDLQLDELLKGTLVIDVADATTRALVWRGIAVGDVDIHAKPEKRDTRITKAVTKILKNYPPTAGRG